MAVSDNGDFKLDLSPKQSEIVARCGARGTGQKIIFVNGPKWTGKTIGALNAVVAHAWSIKGARINVIVPSITTGDDSGVWSVLTEEIIPEWIAGDFGFDWWTPKTGKRILGPRQKGTSKKLYCEVRNKWGGKSHIEMNSLKDERDVETEFFNRYFTMIYWGELQNFKERHTFDTLQQALRMKGHHEDDFLMLCDGNPSDQGEDSWQHKLFYQFRLADDVKPEEKPLQKKLQVIEVYLDENPYLTDEKKAEIKSSYAHDPDLYDRYILGKWVKATTNALFNSVFKPSIHVIGNLGVSDPEMLVPDEGCIELITGWDPGGANPATVFAEKMFRTVATPASNGKEAGMKEESVFKFIDELVFCHESFSIAEFTELVVEKMDFWERWLGRKVRWQHWSDRSAFDFREPISSRFVYEEVWSASDKRIKLDAVDKRPGSVGQGIRLWRKLLFQERVYFSAANTPKIIEMNQSLKRDTRRGMPADSVEKNQNARHVLDACRYLTSAELWDELQGDIVALDTADRPLPKIITARL